MFVQQALPRPYGRRFLTSPHCPEDHGPTLRRAHREARRLLRSYYREHWVPEADGGREQHLVLVYAICA